MYHVEILKLTNQRLGAVAVLTAAKAGDTAKVNQTTIAWYANANQIAAFLHNANPTRRPLGALRTMMHRCLTLTLEEATAQLHGYSPASIGAFDGVEQEILQMTDMLTTESLLSSLGASPGDPCSLTSRSRY